MIEQIEDRESGASIREKLNLSIDASNHSGEILAEGMIPANYLSCFVASVNKSTNQTAPSGEQGELGNVVTFDDSSFYTNAPAEASYLPGIDAMLFTPSVKGAYDVQLSLPLTKAGIEPWIWKLMEGVNQPSWGDPYGISHQPLTGDLVVADSALDEIWTRSDATGVWSLIGGTNEPAWSTPRSLSHHPITRDLVVYDTVLDEIWTRSDATGVWSLIGGTNEPNWAIAYGMSHHPITGDLVVADSALDEIWTRSDATGAWSLIGGTNEPAWTNPYALSHHPITGDLVVADVTLDEIWSRSDATGAWSLIGGTNEPNWSNTWGLSHHPIDGDLVVTDVALGQLWTLSDTTGVWSLIEGSNTPDWSQPYTISHHPITGDIVIADSALAEIWTRTDVVSENGIAQISSIVEYSADTTNGEDGTWVQESSSRNTLLHATGTEGTSTCEWSGLVVFREEDAYYRVRFFWASIGEGDILITPTQFTSNGFTLNSLGNLTIREAALKEVYPGDAV